MTDDEKFRLVHHATASFAGVKHVPPGYVAHSIAASAAELGLSPTVEEKTELVEKVTESLKILFGG